MTCSNYIPPEIVILDMELTEMVGASSSDPAPPEDEKVNVTFISIVNTDYDDRIELEL